MKNKKIGQIEELLSKALLDLNEKDYLFLLNSNEYLKKYDSVMSKMDDVIYSDNYLSQLNDELLDDIINYLEEKLTIN